VVKEIKNENNSAHIKKYTVGIYVNSYEWFIVYVV
jgi:hypothetical protein